MRSSKVLAAVLAVLMGVSGGCASLEGLGMRRPTASLQGVKFQDVTLQAATLVFDIEVDNPYSVELPLTNLDYQLSREAQPFLTGQADVQGAIPAQGKKVLPLPVKVGYLDLVRAFKGVEPGATIPYQAELGLSVNAPVAGRLRLPIKKQGELQVPNIPKASDIDLRKLLEKAKGL